MVTPTRRRINAVLERIRILKDMRAYPGYCMPNGLFLLSRQEAAILSGDWVMSNAMRRRLRLAALENERLGRLSKAERQILREQVEREK